VDYLKAVTRGVESYPLLEVPPDLVDNVITRIEERKTIWVSTQERAYIFSGAEILCTGKLTGFPKGISMILYGSVRLMVRLYFRTVTSALRHAKAQGYFSLTRIGLRRSMKWVS
jgi:hypothetical protein